VTTNYTMFPQRTGISAPSPGAKPAMQTFVKPVRSVHHVRPGDNLNSIAAQYGMTPGELTRLNSHAVGSGGVVHPGMRLQV
jgi:LysM repeat protein